MSLTTFLIVFHSSSIYFFLFVFLQIFSNQEKSHILAIALKDLENTIFHLDLIVLSRCENELKIRKMIS